MTFGIYKGHGPLFVNSFCALTVNCGGISLRVGTAFWEVSLDPRALCFHSANQRDRTLCLLPWVLSSGLFAPSQVSQVGNSISEAFEGLYIRAESLSLSCGSLEKTAFQALHWNWIWRVLSQCVCGLGQVTCPLCHFKMGELHLFRGPH